MLTSFFDLLFANPTNLKWSLSLFVGEIPKKGNLIAFRNNF